MNDTFPVECERYIDDPKVWYVGMWHIHQHLQRLKLWVIDEVGHRADPTAGDRFGAEQDLPLCGGPHFEPAL